MRRLFALTLVAAALTMSVPASLLGNAGTDDVCAATLLEDASACGSGAYIPCNTWVLVGSGWWMWSNC
jgi:hypothetical protein